MGADVTRVCMTAVTVTMIVRVFRCTERRTFSKHGSQVAEFLAQRVRLKVVHHGHAIIVIRRASSGFGLRGSRSRCFESRRL